MKNLPIIFACLALSLGLSLNAATPPKTGDKAPDFALQSLDNKTFRLSDLTQNGNVVLIILRGWPGYQCPVCSRQVQDYITTASGFADAKARIIMVYPGPADALKEHAKEFLENKQWPKDFIFVTDPDYSMIKAYGLRWEAPKETAYPSTFLIDKQGTVRFVKISHSHGDQTRAADMLGKINEMPKN